MVVAYVYNLFYFLQQLVYVGSLIACKIHQVTGRNFNFKMPLFQRMVESLYGEMDKMVSLLRMGFTEEEVSSAIDSFGRLLNYSILLASITTFT
jgi:hypothetical protein